LHPLATDVASGAAVDLHPTIADPPSLRRALRASAGLPVLAGPPVAVDGHTFVDAGLVAAIPIRAAIEQGATHILVLRSRRPGEAAITSRRVSGGVTAAVLRRRISPAVGEAFRTRARREAADEALLARHDADPDLQPHILSVRPAAGSAVPGRLERDVAVVEAGLEAGRAALHAAFSAGAS
jgi:predicted acylesterase/phospholipase RssA